MPTLLNPMLKPTQFKEKGTQRREVNLVTRPHRAQGMVRTGTKAGASRAGIRSGARLGLVPTTHTKMILARAFIRFLVFLLQRLYILDPTNARRIIPTMAPRRRNQDAALPWHFKHCRGASPISVQHTGTFRRRRPQCNRLEGRTDLMID